MQDNIFVLPSTNSIALPFHLEAVCELCMLINWLRLPVLSLLFQNTHLCFSQCHNLWNDTEFTRCSSLLGYSAYLGLNY